MTPFTIGPGTGGEIPVGTHIATINEATESTSSKGNPQLRITLEDAQHRHLTDWVSMLPTAQWRAEQLWAAAGVQWPAPGGQIDENDLIDKQVEITVHAETYEGVTRQKVKAYALPVAGDVALPLPGQETFAAAAKTAGDDEPIPF